MPQLSRDWGVPQESAARATTVFAVAYAWGSLASGPLSDRYGRRTILAGTVAAMAVATALVPLATGLLWVSAARALQRGSRPGRSSRCRTPLCRNGSRSGCPWR
ncbi:MFS transporter [Streptomyces sp. AK04-4c]|uniref:MFS transporter n=1 Tax=Streptomyces sp. AK04-4c TaxID=3028651 RepID=UPI0029B977FB|nr:MFS transporter [Streptomyces sp. AK04-4c]MDX3685276.1 MFS transporter [Streptomyces sp. AK04-4c]